MTSKVLGETQFSYFFGFCIVSQNISQEPGDAICFRGGKNQWQKKRFNQNWWFLFKTCQHIFTHNYFWCLCLEILNMMSKRSHSQHWELAGVWRGQAFSRPRSHLQNSNFPICMSVLEEQHQCIKAGMKPICGAREGPCVGAMAGFSIQ